MAELAVANYDGPSPEALQEKRRRLARAYAEEGYSEEEYNWRLAEIKHQLQQASTITNPAIEEAAELFSDIPMLWNEATPDERRRLIGTLIEMVYVDLEAKCVDGFRLAPPFRALFGTAIETAPDAPVSLTPSVENRESVGDGGDGGELNPP